MDLLKILDMCDKELICPNMKGEYIFFFLTKGNVGESIRITEECTQKLVVEHK